MNEILKLDKRLTDYLSKYEKLTKNSYPIENACAAALKLRNLVSSRIELIEELRKLEIRDIRQNHSREFMVRYLVSRKLNHSARDVQISEEFYSPINIKKLLKKSQGVELRQYPNEFKMSVCEEEEMRLLEITIINSQVPVPTEQSLKENSVSVRIKSKYLNRIGSNQTISSTTSPCNIKRNDSILSNFAINS